MYVVDTIIVDIIIFNIMGFGDKIFQIKTENDTPYDNMTILNRLFSFHMFFIFSQGEGEGVKMVKLVSLDT